VTGDRAISGGPPMAQSAPAILSAHCPHGLPVRAARSERLEALPPFPSGMACGRDGFALRAVRLLRGAFLAQSVSRCFTEPSSTVCASQSAVPGGSIKPKETLHLDRKTFTMAASQNVSITRVGNDARYKRSSKVRRRQPVESA